MRLQDSGFAQALRLSLPARRSCSCNLTGDMLPIIKDPPLGMRGRIYRCHPPSTCALLRSPNAMPCDSSVAGATKRSQPHPIIEQAFTKFEVLVGVNDARLFISTTLEDVREAARIIERDQSQRRCLRNMRRIEPLFEALQLLSGAIETLCQGTPYLCFIWVNDSNPFGAPTTQVMD